MSYLENNRYKQLYLAKKHSLDHTQYEQLDEILTPDISAKTQQQWLQRILLMLGGMCLGLALIFWVAANWTHFSLAHKFILTQGILAASLLLSCFQTRARFALLLLVFMALGGLLALYAQEYSNNTGPWRLFAIWALMGVPLVLAGKHQAIWLFWLVVNLIAVGLWYGEDRVDAWYGVNVTQFIIFVALLIFFSVLLYPRGALKDWLGTSPQHAFRWSVIYAFITILVLGIAEFFFMEKAALWYCFTLIYLTLLCGAVYLLYWLHDLDRTVAAMGALCIDVVLVMSWVRVFTDSHADSATWLFVVLTAGGLSVFLLFYSLKLLKKYAYLYTQTNIPFLKPVDTGGGGRSMSQVKQKSGNPVMSINTSSAWEQRVQQAIEKGLIASPVSGDHEDTPWSTLVLTFIGAFMSTLLFVAAIVLFLDLVHIEDATALYVIGSVLVVGSMAFLVRRSGVTLFLQLLSFIMLAVGVITLAGTYVFDDWIDYEYIFLFTGGLVLACACLIYPAWMRASGSFTGAILIFIFMSEMHGHGSAGWGYASILIPPLAVIIGILFQRQLEKNALWKMVLWLESLINGWLAATFLWLAYSSGSAIFMGYFVPFSADAVFAGGIGNFELLFLHLQSPLAWMQILMLLLMYSWARIQNSIFTSQRLLIFTFAVALFSFLIPQLAVCLALIFLAYATYRVKLALLGGLAALWIVGSLYYMMTMTLTEKALWLAIMGGVLIFVAMYRKKTEAHLSRRESHAQEYDTTHFAYKRVTNLMLIALTALVAFGGVNASIWQQEKIRNSGIEVLLPLAPVDPRSLMQGDYMELNFSIPSEIAMSEDGAAYLSIDEDGIGHFVTKEDEGDVPFLLEKKGGRWRVATDAWFFMEGDAKRWEQARYGVFKVDAKGRSSLVGMADADLEKIRFLSSSEKVR